MLLQCGARDQAHCPRIAGHTAEIIGKDGFRLGELPEGELCRALEIVACRKRGKAGTDAIAYTVSRGILVLFGKFQAAKIISQEMIGIGFENWIDILVRCGEVLLGYADLGAAQTSQRIVGVELERGIEKTFRPVLVASRPQHFRLDQESLG